jgi:MFS family permease
VPKLRYPEGGLWRHRDFMKLWSGQTISEFGTAISQLALPTIAVLVLHASAFQVALLGTVEFLPFLLFTLPAGVWVDRLPRRAILIVGDLGRGALGVSVPIAYALGDLHLAQLYVVGFLTGVLTVFFDVAYQSYLPALVEREQLVEGNSKLEVTRSGAQVAGPGLAGLLIKLATAPYAVLVDTASFAFSGGFLLAIGKREARAERHDEAVPRSLRHELWEGLRYVLGHRLLRPQAISTGTSNFFSNVVYAVLIVYAYRRLHLSPFAIGIVFSLSGLGWMAGAAASSRLQRRLGVGGTTVLGTLCAGPALLLMPLAPRSFPLPMLIAGGALGAFGAVVYNIAQVSLRQTITPLRLQGRMNSVMRFLVWGTIPLGSLTGGALASTIGLRETLFVGGAGGFTSVLPIVFSPIRGLRDFPEPEEPLLPTVAMAEGGLAPGVTAGLDEGAMSGAGPAASDDG